VTHEETRVIFTDKSYLQNNKRGKRKRAGASTINAIENPTRELRMEQFTALFFSSLRYPLTALIDIYTRHC